MSWHQMQELLADWVHHVLWYEQTEAQKQNPKNWHRIRAALLYKKVAWKYAAVAVIQYGLPRLDIKAANSNDATKRIRAVGEFAKDLARWM